MRTRPDVQLQDRHIRALSEAERLIDDSDLSAYLKIKEMFSRCVSRTRGDFESTFARHYGFGAARVIQEFKEKFFSILFGKDVLRNGEPQFEAILESLRIIPRGKRDHGLQFSFVSKLVGLHDESSPIYDRHVLSFFGKQPPPSSWQRGLRFTWFRDFLRDVRDSYISWENDAEVGRLLEKLKQRNEGLNGCHVVRLLDLLVWTAGKRGLLRREAA